MTDKEFCPDIDTAAGLFCERKEPWVLAMAYVPWQEWNEAYDEETALQRGTLFPELDKPFLGRKQVRHG